MIKLLKTFYAFIVLFSVLNVFDGQLRITNMEWDENLHRKSSEIYQILSKELKDELMNLFKDVPSDKSSQVMVKVNKFAPGSVVVLYTVGWLAERDVLTSATVRNCSILCRHSQVIKLPPYIGQIDFFTITHPFTIGQFGFRTISTGTFQGQNHHSPQIRQRKTLWEV